MIPSAVLKEFRLFDGLGEIELAEIAKRCQERVQKAGTICFVQGNKAAEVHLCRSGRVDMTLQLYEPAGMEVKVHTIKEGEVFGWSAIIEPHIFTSSAKCAGRVEEIYIKGANLLSLFEKNNRIGYMVMKNLSAIISSRLTEDRQRLSKELSPDYHL